MTQLYYTMQKKSQAQAFREVLTSRGIHSLYHFTDRENLESIIRSGGLYSWASCEKKGISIPKSGGDSLSHLLDSKAGLEDYVRVSFTTRHPMMYVAMNEGRISNPVILQIDPEVIEAEGVLFADRNATRNGVQIGANLDDLKRIHFDTVKANKHFDVDSDEQPFYQAEVLIPGFIPLQYIRNIGNFGISIPSQPQLLQTKEPYTAQITRNTPTAFIFLIDHSVSMRRKTQLYGEEMTLAEAAARLINQQINELVLRCVKANETRRYYDIAVIGYGQEVYSAWGGELEGRDFVSPEELKNNPYRKVVVREEVRTRRGTTVKEVEKVQWIDARTDGRCTHVHKAFDRAKNLLDQWMEEHHEKDCYPPTIINITDGEFNGASKDSVMQQANELKSLFTNDGNVILFNIHISPHSDAAQVACPLTKDELQGNCYAETLFSMSSLLPLRYNQDIARCLNDYRDGRHVAMGVNVDAGMLIKLMDIGTPTNISKNQ